MDLTSIGKKLTDATTALAKADKDLKLEMAGAAADAAGILDPSPASDIVGAGISIARGDYWGAALSTASMVPYVGDLLAKPAKAVRATKAIAGLEKKVAALTKTVTDLKKAKKEAEAVEAAAKEVKLAREADVAKDAAIKQEKSAAKKEKDCEDCGASETKTSKQVSSGIDSLAARYAQARNSGEVFTWERFANQAGVDPSTLNRATQSAIRNRAKEMDLVPKALVDDNGIADFSHWTAEIVEKGTGFSRGKNINLPETTTMPYGRHFDYLDSLFEKPEGYLWDHMASDGQFQAVQRGVHATTPHKGFALWLNKVK